MISITQAIDTVKSMGGKMAAKGKNYAKFHALHRQDKEASLVVFAATDGGVIVKDHSTGQSWSFYRYLVEMVGVSKEEARRICGMDGGQPVAPKPRPNRWQCKLAEYREEYAFAYIPDTTDELKERAMKEWDAALARLNEWEKYGSYAESRNLTPGQMLDAGLGLGPRGEIVIPVFDSHGRLKNVKVRNPNDNLRYRYVLSGSGVGYYFSPGFEKASMVYLVEGELNAAAVYLATGAATIGIPGASTGLSEDLCKNLLHKLVVIIGDQDEAGYKLVRRMILQLQMAGIERANILIPQQEQFARDAMDLLAKGMDYLKHNLEKRVRGSRVLGAVRSQARVVRMIVSDVGATSFRLAAALTGYTTPRPALGVMRPDDYPYMMVAWDWLRETIGAKRTGAVFHVWKQYPLSTWCDIGRALVDEPQKKQGFRFLPKNLYYKDTKRKNRAMLRLDRLKDHVIELLDKAINSIRLHLERTRKKLADEWAAFAKLFAWAAPFVRKDRSVPLTT